MVGSLATRINQVVIPWVGHLNNTGEYRQKAVRAAHSASTYQRLVALKPTTGRPGFWA